MDYIILIAGLVGLLWGTLFVFRGWLPAGCLAFILAATCLGHAFVEFNLGPLPLTIDRVVLAVLLAAYIVQRRMGRAQPKPMAAADWLLVLLVGTLGVSTFTHEWRALPGDVSPVWRLMFGYLMPIALYWVARQSAITERGLWWIQGLLTAFGVYLAVTGLAEVAGQWWLVFPKYISDPKVGIHFGRARGPMVQAACYGTVLAFCLLAAWTWRPKLSRPGQLLLLATLPLFAGALYFTYTRSAWGEAVLGLMVVLGLTLKGRWRVGVISGIAACGILFAAAKWDSLMGFQREQSAGDTRKSAEMRGSFAYASWLMFQDRPLWGCGFGQYRFDVLPYLSDRSSEHDLESIRGYVHHNTLLCLLVETGLIGTLLFLGVLGGWALTAWQIYRDPETPDWAKTQSVLLLALLATYICQLLSRDVTYTGIENMVVFFMAGVTMSLRPKTENVASVARAPSGVPAWNRQAAGPAA